MPNSSRSNVTRRSREVRHEWWWKSSNFMFVPGKLRHLLRKSEFAAHMAARSEHPAAFGFILKASLHALLSPKASETHNFSSLLLLISDAVKNVIYDLSKCQWLTMKTSQTKPKELPETSRGISFPNMLFSKLELWFRDEIKEILMTRLWAPLVHCFILFHPSKSSGIQLTSR